MRLESNTILYSKENGVAQIVLNRPDSINAYNTEMRDELFQALLAVRDDPEVLVAIFQGSGSRGFCSGADLTEFGTTPSQAIARTIRSDRDIWGLFLNLHKPLIAALHGYVIGVGLELACLCDLRIAAHDTFFQMPEVALGMIPTAGGTQTIPRIITSGNSIEIMLTNRRLSAEQAKSIGLVHHLVSMSELNHAATRLARLLTSHNSDILAIAKRAIVDGIELPLCDALKLEERLLIQLLSDKNPRFK